MDILSLLRDLLFDYTLRTVALGAATLGIVSGAMGSYAVLRKQSLLGDAISHAALPGIALAFMLTGSKAPLILLFGAAIAGWLATLVILAIVRTTRVKYDSALGLVLSVFFGFGMVLLTFIQKQSDATQAGLDSFLFGQAATLLERDVVTMAALGVVAIAIMLIFWKELKLLSFDPGFAASLGLPVRLLDILITALLVIAIVIGLQTVGVVLMSAMVVAPAAAARQWTNKMGVMVVLAALFGALAGVSGAMISSSVTHLPTGPTVVLCISAITLLSLLLSPTRGVLWNWLQRQRNRSRLRLEAVLYDLYTLAQQHTDPHHGHSIEVLRMMSAGQPGVRRSLNELVAKGWARNVGPDEWALTPEGVAQARKLAPQGQEDGR